MPLGIYTSFMAAVMWATNGITARYVSKRLGNIIAAIIVLLSGLPIFSIALFFSVNEVINFSVVFFSILAGFLVFLGYILFYKSLQKEKTGSTYAFIELQAALIVIFGVLIFGETLPLLKLLSIIIIFFGLFLVLINKNFRLNKNLIPSLFANIFWALSWVAEKYAINYANGPIYPIVFTYYIASFFVLIYYMTNKTSLVVKKLELKKAPNKVIYIGILSGIVDAIGNISFAFTAFYNYLDMGAAIANISPAIVTLFAYFIFKEKVTRLQLVGIILTIIGSIMVAII